MIMDFCFYHFYCLYNKNRTEESPIYTASLYLSFLQFVFCCSLLIMTAKYFKYDISDILTDYNKEFILLQIVGAFIIFAISNYFYYRLRVDKVLSKYRRSKLNSGYIVAGLFLFILLFLFCVLFLM